MIGSRAKPFNIFPPFFDGAYVSWRSKRRERVVANWADTNVIHMLVYNRETSNNNAFLPRYQNKDKYAAVR